MSPTFLLTVFFPFAVAAVRNLDSNSVLRMHTDGHIYIYVYECVYNADLNYMPAIQAVFAKKIMGGQYK